MTEFEQVIISELVEIKKILIDIYANTSNTFQDLHNVSDYLIYDISPCPNKFDIFDHKCQVCSWRDICTKESKDE